MSTQEKSKLVETAEAAQPPKSFYDIPTQELQERIVPKTLKEAVELGKQIGFDTLRERFWGGEAEDQANKAFGAVQNQLKKNPAAVDKIISNYEDEYQLALQYHVKRHAEQAGEYQYHGYEQLQLAQEKQKAAEQYKNFNPLNYQAELSSLDAKFKEKMAEVADIKKQAAKTKDPIEAQKLYEIAAKKEQNAKDSIQKQSAKYQHYEQSYYDELTKTSENYKKSGMDFIAKAEDWTKFVYYYEKTPNEDKLQNIAHFQKTNEVKLAEKQAIVNNPNVAFSQLAPNTKDNWLDKAHSQLKNDAAYKGLSQAQRGQVKQQKAIALYAEDAQKDVTFLQKQKESYGKKQMLYGDLSKYELEGEKQVTLSAGMSKEATEKEQNQWFGELAATVTPTKYNVDLAKTEQVKIEKPDAIYTYTFSKPVLDVLKKEVTDPGETIEQINAQAVERFETFYKGDASKVPVQVKVLEATYQPIKGRQDKLEFVKDDSGAITGYKYIPDPTRDYYSETSYKVPIRLLEAVKKQDNVSDDTAAVQLLTTKYKDKGVPVGYDTGFALIFESTLGAFTSKLNKQINENNMDISNTYAQLLFKQQYGIDPKDITVSYKGKDTPLSKTGISYTTASSWFSNITKEEKKQSKAKQVEVVEQAQAFTPALTPTVKQEPQKMFGTMTIEQAKQDLNKAPVVDQKKQELGYAWLVGTQQAAAEAAGGSSALKLTNKQTDLMKNTQTIEVNEQGKNKSVLDVLGDYKQELNDYYNKPVFGSLTKAEITESIAVANNKEYQKAVADAQTQNYEIVKSAGKLDAIIKEANAGNAPTLKLTDKDVQVLKQAGVADPLGIQAAAKYVAGVGFDDTAIASPTKKAGNVTVFQEVGANANYGQVSAELAYAPPGPQSKVASAPKPTDNPLADFVEGFKAPFENIIGGVKAHIEGKGDEFKPKADIEGDLIGLGIEAAVDYGKEGKTDVSGKDFEKIGKNIADNPAYAAGNIVGAAITWLGPGEVAKGIKIGSKVAQEVGLKGALTGLKAGEAAKVVKGVSVAEAKELAIQAAKATGQEVSEVVPVKVAKGAAGAETTPLYNGPLGTAMQQVASVGPIDILKVTKPTAYEVKSGLDTIGYVEAKTSDVSLVKTSATKAEAAKIVGQQVKPAESITVYDKKLGSLGLDIGEQIVDVPKAGLKASTATEVYVKEITGLKKAGQPASVSVEKVPAQKEYDVVEGLQFVKGTDEVATVKNLIPKATVESEIKVSSAKGVVTESGDILTNEGLKTGKIKQVAEIYEFKGGDVAKAVKETKNEAKLEAAAKKQLGEIQKGKKNAEPFEVSVKPNTKAPKTGETPLGNQLAYEFDAGLQAATKDKALKGILENIAENASKKAPSILSDMTISVGVVGAVKSSGALGFGGATGAEKVNQKKQKVTIETQYIPTPPTSIESLAVKYTDKMQSKQPSMDKQGLGGKNILDIVVGTKQGGSVSSGFSNTTKAPNKTINKLDFEGQKPTIGFGFGGTTGYKGMLQSGLKQQTNEVHTGKVVHDIIPSHISKFDTNLIPIPTRPPPPPPPTPKIPTLLGLKLHPPDSRYRSTRGGETSVLDIGVKNPFGAGLSTGKAAKKSKKGKNKFRII